MQRPSYVPTAANLPFKQKLAAVIRLLPTERKIKGNPITKWPKKRMLRVPSIHLYRPGMHFDKTEHLLNLNQKVKS